MNKFGMWTFPVISQDARYESRHDASIPWVTFTGKSITIGASHLNNCIIVCGGNVDIWTPQAVNSLIIARGEVVIRDLPTGTFVDNHIIAGKTVKHSLKQPNIIRENDRNPLGFVRWSDTPKEKPKPR